jgi:sulfite reductase alpha subunit-like flavoprotein
VELIFGIFKLESYQNDGHLKLHTAFSRDQKQKIYVQHRLKETASEVWRLLEVRIIESLNFEL